jgi:uncharacterized protein YjbI with pentapeptide repeats
MLVEAKLEKADLSGANLKGANLSKCDLRTVRLARDLTGANLTSANLSSSDLTYMNFTHANLTSANLSASDLTFANLTSADVSFANLTAANLTAVKFASTVLTATLLSSATLGEINFGKTDLSRCELKKAVFRRCELREAKLPLNLPNVQMIETKWFQWSATQKGNHGIVEGLKAASTGNQYCVVLGDRVMEGGEFEVTLTSANNSVEIGLMREPFQEPYDRDFGRLQGWAFNCSLRRLFSGVPEIQGISQSYANVTCKQGDRITVRVNKADSTIEYAINGQWKGVAFRNVTGPLRPAVSLYNQSAVAL